MHQQFMTRKAVIRHGIVSQDEACVTVIQSTETGSKCPIFSGLPD